jgi:hypothetical protein
MEILMGTMWHNFIALPLVAKIIALIGVAALSAWGLLKRKTLATIASALTDAVGERFWGYVRRKLDTGAKPSTRPSTPNDRIYRGIFQGYAQHQHSGDGYPSQRFLTLVDGATTIKIPVSRTDLFAHVQPGQYVEVDTKTGVFNDQEIVQRVRVMDKPKSGGRFISPG